MPTSSTHTPELTNVLSKLVGTALADEPYDRVYKEFCDGLVDAGLPLLRCFLVMQTLHPLVSAVDVTWLRGHDIAIKSYEHSNDTTDEWLKSPLHWMISHKQSIMRRDLSDQVLVKQYPLFGELWKLGATDYLAIITPFGDPETVFEHKDGVITSWVTDAPDGFTGQHIESLQNLQPYLALVAKHYKQQYTARNVVSAYLGEEVGQHVLEGQIRLGDVERIPAVIWLCDLRNSTPMAEQLVADEYLRSLNAYFDCTAGAVLSNGGQVLSFIGDAVLAVFPVTEQVSLNTAAKKALSATQEANRRISALNQDRIETSQNPMTFGLALHVGDVHYGNIGVPTRIEFSVIGSAVNEVSRLESMTKVIGEPLLVSRAFKESTDQPWRCLGIHDVKGMRDGLEIFAPL